MIWVCDLVMSRVIKTDMLPTSWALSALNLLHIWRPGNRPLSSACIQNKSCTFHSRSPNIRGQRKSSKRVSLGWFRPAYAKIPPSGNYLSPKDAAVPLTCQHRWWGTSSQWGENESAEREKHDPPLELWFSPGGSARRVCGASDRRNRERQRRRERGGRWRGRERERAGESQRRSERGERGREGGREEVPCSFSPALPACWEKLLRFLSPPPPPPPPLWQMRDNISFLSNRHFTGSWE